MHDLEADDPATGPVRPAGPIALGVAGAGGSGLTATYQRVDIGFSKVVSLRTTVKPHVYSLESLWLGLEILNILGANNVAGYSYLQDVNGRTYGVPSYLSQRVVNARLIARF